MKYSIMAGERALDTYAFEDALAHFERALESREGQAHSTSSGQAMDAETADMLFGLGRAQVAAAERHQAQEAMDNFIRAFDYYVEVGKVSRAVAVARGPFPWWTHLTGLAPLLARALKLVPPGSHQAGYLLAHYCRVLGTSTTEPDYEGAQRAFQRALAIAQREQDTTLEIIVLTQGAWVDVSHLHSRKSLEKSLRAIELASRGDDHYFEEMAQVFATGSLLAIGDLEGARPHATAMLTLAEKLRRREELAEAHFMNARISRLEGDWRTARDMTDRGLAVSPMEPNLLGIRALLECEIGEFSQGEAHLERLLEASRLVPPGPNFESSVSALAIPLVAGITGVADRSDVAQAAAAAVLSSPYATALHAVPARAGLALIAVQRDDAAAAAEQHATLESYRGIMLQLVSVSIDRVLGLLAQTMGRSEDAMAHFEDALAFCTKAGYRPELAWTCHDYAEALLDTIGPNDQKRWVPLVDEGLAIARELGMVPLLERLACLREKIRPDEARRAYPAGLTQREVEVLRLIAVGKSNREIAEELIISPHTVSYHVKKIFNKTDASNRAEAVAYAARHDLVY